MVMVPLVRKSTEPGSEHGSAMPPSTGGTPESGLPLLDEDEDALVPDEDELPPDDDELPPDDDELLPPPLPLLLQAVRSTEARRSEARRMKAPGR
jgi:hypothetical protein